MAYTRDQLVRAVVLKNFKKLLGAGVYSKIFLDPERSDWAETMITQVLVKEILITDQGWWGRAKNFKPHDYLTVLERAIENVDKNPFGYDQLRDIQDAIAIHWRSDKKDDVDEWLVGKAVFAPLVKSFLKENDGARPWFDRYIESAFSGRADVRTVSKEDLKSAASKGLVMISSEQALIIVQSIEDLLEDQGETLWKKESSALKRPGGSLKEIIRGEKTKGLSLDRFLTLLEENFLDSRLSLESRRSFLRIIRQKSNERFPDFAEHWKSTGVPKDQAKERNLRGLVLDQVYNAVFVEKFKANALAWYQSRDPLQGLFTDASSGNLFEDVLVAEVQKASPSEELSDDDSKRLKEIAREFLEEMAKTQLRIFEKQGVEAYPGKRVYLVEGEPTVIQKRVVGHLLEASGIQNTDFSFTVDAGRETKVAETVLDFQMTSSHAVSLGDFLKNTVYTDSALRQDVLQLVLNKVAMIANNMMIETDDDSDLVRAYLDAISLDDIFISSEPSSESDDQRGMTLKIHVIPPKSFIETYYRGQLFAYPNEDSETPRQSASRRLNLILGRIASKFIDETVAKSNGLSYLNFEKERTALVARAKKVEGSQSIRVKTKSSSKNFPVNFREKVPNPELHSANLEVRLNPVFAAESSMAEGFSMSPRAEFWGSKKELNFDGVGEEKTNYAVYAPKKAIIGSWVKPNGVHFMVRERGRKSEAEVARTNRYLDFQRVLWKSDSKVKPVVPVSVSVGKKRESYMAYRMNPAVTGVSTSPSSSSGAMDTFTSSMERLNKDLVENSEVLPHLVVDKESKGGKAWHERHSFAVV